MFQLVIDDDAQTVVGFANPTSPVFLLAQLVSFCNLHKLSKFLLASILLYDCDD